MRSPRTPAPHISRTPNLKDFRDWLLATTPHSQGQASAMVNKDAILIAHNFKGYDGQFILNYLVHTACITPTVIMNGTKILSMQALDALKYKPFPLGHPEIITEDLQDVRSYFRMVLCRVLPPR